MQEKNKRKFDDIKLRLLQFAENQGIPKMDFYKKISVPQSNFGGKSMESSLSSSKITEILIIFPQINPDWLLMGNGTMLRESVENSGGKPESPPDTGLVLELTRQISELSRENGQLQAENTELKKELARSEAAAAASARTA